MSLLGGRRHGTSFLRTAKRGLVVRAMMAKTVTQEGLQNQWDDLFADDPLFSPVVKGFFAAGFILMALAFLVLHAVTLHNAFEGTINNPDGSESAQHWFRFVAATGTLLFAGGFVAGGLMVSRMAVWARITLLVVAAFVLLGGSVGFGSFSGLF